MWGVLEQAFEVAMVPTVETRGPTGAANRITEVLKARLKIAGEDRV